MDNRRFEIYGDLRNAALDHAIAMAMVNHWDATKSSHTAIGYLNDPIKIEHGNPDKLLRLPRLTLFHREPMCEIGHFLTPKNHTETVKEVRAWLNVMPRKDYGPQPDHDGDNGLGFHLWLEMWEMVDGQRNALFAVEPCWAWYGK